MLANRYLNSAATLMQKICIEKPPFSTLNSTSNLILASNSNSLNQLISESYQHLFIFEMSLDDINTSNAGAARVISNPFFEFPYRVSNFSSYPTISALSNAGGRPIGFPLGPYLVTVINSPSYGYISAIKQIIKNCLAGNFKFSKPFSARIFQSNYTLYSNFSYYTTAYDSLNIAIMDDSNKVIFINASWPGIILQNPPAYNPEFQGAP